MPRDVRTTTNNNERGSGPKNDVNDPLICVAVSSTSASFATASAKPPFVLRTATITATIPASIIMP